MEVTFGIQARDGSLRVQIADDKVSELRAQLEEAIAGEGNKRLLWVTDKDGKEWGIPTDKIAFVELGTEKSSRQVGFSAAS